MDESCQGVRKAVIFQKVSHFTVNEDVEEIKSFMKNSFVLGNEGYLEHHIVDSRRCHMGDAQMRGRCLDFIP